MDTQDNTAAAATGARISVNLIDAIDLLNEARQINEAAHMACMSMHDRQQRDAMQRIIGLCSDILTNVTGNLEVVRAETREGGAI